MKRHIKYLPKDGTDPNFTDGIRKAYDGGNVVVDTEELRRWVLANSSRGVTWEFIREKVDPEGLHLGTILLFHNDQDFRCRFYVKVLDTAEPVEITIDLTTEEWGNAREMTAHGLASIEEKV